MLRRKSNPIYYHEGYIFRHFKCLSDGSPLLYCDNRKTEVGCNALAHLRNGSVVLKRAHNGHKANDGIAKAKLAKTSLKERAGVCSKPPRELLFDAKLQFGTIPVDIGRTKENYARMIQRVRKSECDDCARVNALISEFTGLMSTDIDGVLDYAPIPPQLPLTGLEFLKAIRSARKYT
uniref:FLYWCH-type domain-containing protein n=1 Tax=Caenorhabditis japonica TaxID=281687 RepID=A0A8R1IKK2_CAEJA